MEKTMNSRLRLFAFVLLCAGCGLGQQNAKTLIVEAEPKSPSEIAIPPSTSQKFDLRADKSSDATRPGSRSNSPLDISSWLTKVSESDGLVGQLQKPWHLVVTYDEFDEDGDNVNSGVYDEIWAGPKKYRRSYKSDKLNQTDYANDKGLFRLGDQRWPGRSETQVRAEIVDPFSYARTLTAGRGSNAVRDFDGYKLDCVVIQGSMAVSDPTQYCFDEGSSVLRYVRGWGWFQTTYNNVIDFQGRNVARSVTVTDGGKPYLVIHVDSLDALSAVSDDQFVAPSDAAPLAGKRVSGVMMQPIKTVPPQWPASFRGRKFEVHVDLVIGKDGHVATAHATSGPEDAAKICVDAIRKWVYPPFKVHGEPVEVEAKSVCSYE